MKFSFRTFLHNSFVVFRRNTIVLEYLIITGLIIFLLVVGVLPRFYLIVLGYFSIRLIWSIIEFVLDYLDSVFVLHGLSDFRKRQYQKRMQWYERRRKSVKKHDKLMMPVQTASHTGMPQMMIFNMKDCDRGGVRDRKG